MDQVIQHEVRGSCCRPKMFYFIKWLDYELEHNFWELETKLSLKNVLKFWDMITCFSEQLFCYGVRSENLPNIPPTLHLMVYRF